MKFKSSVRSFACALACALSGAFALPSPADTVAWWHFDEADPGTKAGVSSIAPDEAPALYAKPYIYVNTTAEVAGSADYEASAYAPTYTKPFGGRGIYDPVTDSRRTNSAAMRFATGHQGNGNNSGRAYHRGTLKVETAGDFYAKCTDALTVECFVCTTNNGPFTWSRTERLRRALTAPSCTAGTKTRPVP